MARIVKRKGIKKGSGLKDDKEPGPFEIRNRKAKEWKQPPRPPGQWMEFDKIEVQITGDWIRETLIRELSEKLGVVVPSSAIFVEYVFDDTVVTWSENEKPCDEPLEGEEDD